ncbi:MAG: RHS repeat-associated core domain-containing protein, partial [Pontiella sp.]
MKIINPIKRTPASISFLLSIIMLVQGLSPLVASAEWVEKAVWVDVYYDEFGCGWWGGYTDTVQCWEDEVDEPDEECPAEEEASDEPIDTRTGNNYFTEYRLEVPGPGLSLELNLNYQSMPARPAGKMGGHWFHSYDWYLDAFGTNLAALATGSGSRFVFEMNTNGTYEVSQANGWELKSEGDRKAVHMPGGRVYSFNPNGWLESIRDAWGVRIYCLYGTNNCLEEVCHVNERSMLFSNVWHDASSEWRVASIAVPNGGAVLDFSYGADGQFTQIVERVDDQSYVSSYQYADGYLTNKINGAGFEYEFGYETGGDGKLNGKGTSLSADGYYPHTVNYVNNQITDVSYDTRGLQQIYRYTRNTDQLFKYGPGNSVPDAQTRGVEYGYSSAGDRTKERQFDGSNEWIRWVEYDESHNPTNIAVSYNTANKIQQVGLEYDPLWKTLCIVEEPDTSRTEIDYTNGLPQTVRNFYTSAQSYDTHYAYSTNGALRTITNANVNVVDLGYDMQGNLALLELSVGPKLSFGYNINGYLASAEFLSESGTFSGRQYILIPDAKGRMTGISYPDGLSEKWQYNALGYVTQTTDRAGRSTDYIYAPTRKLTSMTRYLGEGGSNTPVRIGFNLDEQVNVLSISEPRGRYVESYQLDIQDRIVAVTNIEDQVMDIDYALGNFVNTITRFDGTMVSNTYNSAGEIATQMIDSESISFDYYSDGRIKSVADSTTALSYKHDLLNQLVAVTSTIPSVVSTADYAYDAVGNITNTVIGFGGQTLEMVQAYDTAERLEITGNHIYSYNPDNGQVAGISNTITGITTSYAYDIMDQITNIAYIASGTNIYSMAYEYDPTGMVTRKTTTGGITSVSSYAYDSLDRLVSETTKTSLVSSAPLRGISYSYDLAGNRTSKTKNGRITSYTLSTGNRLESSETAATNTIRISGNASELIGNDPRWGSLEITNLTAGVSVVPGINGTSFHATIPVVTGTTNNLIAAIRDQAGNMGYATNAVFANAFPTGGTSSISSYAYNTAGCVTNLNGISLEWDERYRLKSVNDGSDLVEYEYDAWGRKTTRTEGVNTEHYIYDIDHVVADLDGSGNLLRSYTYGQGIDNILTMTTYALSGTNTYYYLKDHLNTVIALTDTSGTIIESYDYDAYGNITIFNASGIEISESAYSNRYTFQGREIDWETGLFYFRARWYDAEIGRWLSKDPIGIRGGLNQYVFCGNNP